MTSQLLKEGVLNDDILMLPDEGKIFKGRYVAIIEYHTFATSWSNKKRYRRFRKIERLEKYLQKNYPKAEVSF